jgi:hypothetical protein
MQSSPQPARGYLAIALLLLIDGVLLAIAESSILLPVPFLLAAYLYFLPTTNLRRQLIGAATLALVALSIILGLSEFSTGLASSVLLLIIGIAVIGLSMVVAALVLNMFFIRKTPV